MILHALTGYYQRKAAANGNIAPEGFENKEIPFVIVLDKQGKFILLEDTREQQSKKKVGRQFLIPKSEVRSGSKSYAVSNILWDHYGYVLAAPKEVDAAAKKTAEEISAEQAKNQEMADKQHESFIRKVNELVQALPDDEGVKAVADFLASPDEITKVKTADAWAECSKIKGCNLSFRLVNEVQDLVCQSKQVRDYVAQKPSESEPSDNTGVCLVTGKKAPIARLHTDIKGLNKTPKSPFVSANEPAFKSYGKDKGDSFPVSETAMFEYTTALNTLLASDNRFRIGDVTAVCWSDKPTPLETALPIILTANKDNPDAHISNVQSLFGSLHDGKYTASNAKDKFYLLGLSPNSARIVVRFWQESTVAEMSENLAQWFEDLKMVRGEKSPYPEYMPLMRLLCGLVLEGKAENLPPNLIADTIQSALNNQPLPQTVLQTALRRNKAEQSISYGRASLIKAYLNRLVRAGRLKTKEINVSLDRQRTDIGYVLGRLFAVLEKTQSEANPSLNATIGDRYFGAASSTPITVFGTLIRLSKHHLSKLHAGRRTNLEKLLQEITANLNGFPSHLNIEQQGLFAIGYYHQKQDFFTKHDTNNEE